MSDPPTRSPAFLPPELLLHIADFLTTVRDLNAFVQVSRFHHATLNRTLYCNDAKSEKPVALLWAAIHDKKEPAAKALQANTNPEITADVSRIKGATPIILTAFYGSRDVLDILLTRDDINPNIRDRSCLCPAITWAVKMNQAWTVRRLLQDERVNVNLQDKNAETALMHAVIANSAMIPVLLSCPRINPQVGDMIGRTPLSRAAQKKHPETPLILVAHLRRILDGFNDREHCQQVFYSAAISGESDIMEHMVKYYGDKLDPNGAARGEAGGSDHAVFIVAVERNLPEIVKFLLLWDKTDPNQYDVWRCKTPLYRAAEQGLENMVSILKEHERVDLNQSSIHGLTPLMIAIEKGHLGVVQCLLSGSRRPDVNHIGDNGATALWLAAMNGQPNFVQRLLEVEGIDAGIADSAGMTPKDIAAMRNHTEVVKMLEDFTIQ